MGGRVNLNVDWLPKEWANRKTKKNLICVVCMKTFSLRSLQEHISTAHLDTRCLQIARCVNKKCNEEAKINPDIFTINFVTSHLNDSRFEHNLLAPKKLCKHRLSNQRLFDDLLELSTFLGYVDESGRRSYSGDANQQKRIDAFHSSATRVIDIDPNHKPARACFVNEYNSEELRKQSRNEDGNMRHDLVEYHSNNQRSPAYDRSPGRSPSTPGRSPGRSPGGSPFPSGGRSPFNGGRSPFNGGSPAYEEPIRSSSRTFFEESTNTSSPPLSGERTKSQTASSYGRSVAKKKNSQLLNVKREPKESEEILPSSSSSQPRRSRFDQKYPSSTPNCTSPPPPKRMNIDNFSRSQTTAYSSGSRQTTNRNGSSYYAHEETRGGPPSSSVVTPHRGVIPRNPPSYENPPPVPPPIRHPPTMTTGNPSSRGAPYSYEHNGNGYRSPSTQDSSNREAAPPNMNSFHRHFNGGFPTPPNGNNHVPYSTFPPFNYSNTPRYPPPSEKLFPRDDRYTKK